jgi:Holliday junction resolvase
MIDMTGSNYERALARVLHQRGCKVMRSPASGSATTRDQPDLFAASDVFGSMAVELKQTKEASAYVKEDEVDALRRFAQAFNAKPYQHARIPE